MSDASALTKQEDDAPDVGGATPPDRTLMGPGPSDVHPRVLKGMSTPLVGHLDPSFVEIMDEVQEPAALHVPDGQPVDDSGLGNRIGVDGSGHRQPRRAGRHDVSPDERLLRRADEVDGRARGRRGCRGIGAVGRTLDPVDVERAFDEHQPDVFGFVHAETSTGVLQPNVPELTDIAHDHDALVIADSVTSLGGVELRVDEWDIDVAYSGPQKCLSCPPGASPLTLNDRAMDKVLGREERPARGTSTSRFWRGTGATTARTITLRRSPTCTRFARRSASSPRRIEARWARHRAVAGDLKAGLQDLGLEMNAPDEYWLPSLNAVRVPDGIDDGAVIDHLLEEYDLEIASGLGDLEGDIWRIGCMGYSARPKNVEYVLAALEDALGQQGSKGSGTTQARSLADRREILCVHLSPR